MQCGAERSLVATYGCLDEHTSSVAGATLPGIFTEQVVFEDETVALDATPCQIFPLQRRSAPRRDDGSRSTCCDRLVGILVVVALVAP